VLEQTTDTAGGVVCVLRLADSQKACILHTQLWVACHAISPTCRVCQAHVAGVVMQMTAKVVG
jgi:hypothetical protein